MKISIDTYTGKVNEIYNEMPDYETGHDGSDGKCDCIGMGRGALNRGGATGVHNMRGTNNAVRNVDFQLQPLTSASQLKVGDILFKTRDKDDPNMRLPDRYRVGGADYDPKWGETNFTHYGSVTNVNPLEITHMTDPKPKKTNSIKGWTWFGKLPWVDYSDQPEPGPEPDPPQPDPPEPQTDKAVVYADNGKPVKMRAKPSSNCKLYWNVPCGTILDVLDWGDTWSNVRGQTEDGYKTGYMMKKFLKPIDEPSPVQQTYTVCIPGLMESTAQKIVNAYSGAWMTPDGGGDDNAVG